MKYYTAAALLAAVGMPCAAMSADAATADGTTVAATDLATRKAEEDLRGAKLANDEKARALAEAKRKEIVTAFPSGDTTGKTDVKGTAGLAEAQGLIAVAINGLAPAIAADAKTAATYSETKPATNRTLLAPCTLTTLTPPAPAGVPVLLLSGSQALSFAHYDQFRFRACSIAKSFDDAQTAANAALGPGPAGSLTGLGAAMTVATQLMKLITPDWEVGSIDTKPSDRALALAVAKAYLGTTIDDKRPLYWQAATSKLGGSDEVFAALQQLDDRDIAAKALAARLKPKVTAAQKAYDKISKKPGAADSNEKKELDKWTKLLAGVTAASESYSQLLTLLNGKAGDAILPINLVIEEAATSLLLGSSGLVVTVNVESAAGGYYSRKVIWNAFDIGGPPFFVTGGTTVSFAAVRPADQRVLAAGQYKCNAGYTKINKVRAKVNGAPAADVALCKP